MSNIIRSIILAIISIGSLFYAFHLGFFHHDAYNFILLGLIALVLLLPHLNILPAKLRIIVLWIILVFLFVYSLRFLSHNNLLMLGILLILVGIIMTFRIILAKSKSDYIKIQHERDQIALEKEKLKKAQDNVVDSEQSHIDKNNLNI